MGGRNEATWSAEAGLRRGVKEAGRSEAEA